MTTTKTADKLFVVVKNILIIGYGENIEYRVRSVNNQYFFKAEKIVLDKKDSLIYSVYESKDILKLEFNFYNNIFPIISEYKVSGYANVKDNDKIFEFYNVVGNANFINISHIAI